MKKRKFNLLLQIATLCLCVAAIAFGVYSAKTASLNVSGTIGFTAHNCKVRVLGQITGAVDASNTAITNNTSTAKINYTDSTNTSQGKLIEGTVDTWDFGKIYFDDLNTEGDAIATDIVFTFTLTNESTAYDVIATLNVNNLPSSIKPTVTFSTGSNNSGVECELKKSGTPVTITLTLSLLTGENISDTTKNLDLKLSFAKVNENQTAEKLGYTLNSSDKSILTGVPATTEPNATLNIPSYFYDTTNNSVVFVKSLSDESPLTKANQYSIISIPSSVTTIGIAAFASCTNLTTITIPSSVTSIRMYAFYNCTALTTINFNGTKNQWNAITKGSGWDNNTGVYTIKCTDGTITKA
ncbi:MAG: leucine-rich repeat domain-containing protein [Eubacteriales bacterium]|nr:leucine-rich repeat domain-containing protein [Eubacteriales bacterium]